jgi:hypothetical protein
LHSGKRELYVSTHPDEKFRRGIRRTNRILREKDGNLAGSVTKIRFRFSEWIKRQIWVSFLDAFNRREHAFNISFQLSPRLVSCLPFGSGLLINQRILSLAPRSLLTSQFPEDTITILVVVQVTKSANSSQRRLNSIASGLTRPDSDNIFQVGNKDFSISNLTGIRG